MKEQNRKGFKISDEILASHSQRFWNFFIDIFIQVLLMMVVVIIAGNIMGEVSVMNYIKSLESNQIRLYIISSCTLLLYYNLFEIFFSKTIGKMFTNTVIVTENGELPKHETILIRTLCRLLPFFPFSFLGIRCRGWHDMISKTYVVNSKLLKEKKQLFYSAKNIE